MATPHARLSVVVPARDEEDIIGDCLLALLVQDDPVDEVIVVDNGSVDTTARRAAAFREVRVLPEPRPGISRARTTGFDAAHGELLARVDADTLVDPGWAGAIREAFARDPGLDAVAGVTRQAHAPAVVARATEQGYRYWRQVHRLRFEADGLLYGHNMALRASAWRRIRPLLSVDDSVSEDIDVSLALQLTGGRIALAPRMRAQADLFRTLSPAKLARYSHADAQVRRKYLQLAGSARPLVGAGGPMS